MHAQSGPTGDTVNERKRRARDLLRSGEAETAAALLKEVLAKAPRDAELLMLLGVALHRCHQHDQAVRHITRVTQLAPARIDAWCQLCSMHAEAGELRKAHQAIDGALKIDPDNGPALSHKARLLESHGQASKAYDLLREVRRRGVAAAEVEAAYCGLCRNLGHNADGIDAARAMLERADLDPPQRRAMFFTLGHLLDASGEYDEAFDAFGRGNATYQSAEPLETAVITGFWSRELLERLPVSKQRSQLPVLIVGMPRSGTTLTDQIITSHPAAGGVGESDFLNQFMLGKTPSSFTPGLLDEIGTGYLDHLGRNARKGTQRVTDKMPENYLALGLVSRALPGARVVHCTRDARDVVLSCFFQDFGPARLKYTRRLETCARRFLVYREIMAYWDEVLDIPIHESAYGELVGDPEQNVRELLGFLGLDYDERCLDFHRSKRSVSTASLSQVRKPLYTTSRQRWRNYEKHLGPALDILGDV